MHAGYGFVERGILVRRAHLLDVTVSIRVMTAGEGYRYLLSTVVNGDGDRDAATALTRYYAEAGTPMRSKSSYVLPLGLRCNRLLLAQSTA